MKNRKIIKKKIYKNDHCEGKQDIIKKNKSRKEHYEIEKKTL